MTPAEGPNTKGVNAPLTESGGNLNETKYQHCALNGHNVRLYNRVSATRKDSTMMISRSFLRGFGRGLAAPGLLVEPYSVRRDPRYDASVEKAWEDVGNALRGAMSMEGSRIGKKTKTTRYDKRKPRQAAE